MNYSIDEQRQMIQAGRYSLIDFSILTDRKYKPNWHHELIAKELEKAEKGIADWKILLLMCPPRSGKSQEASINFPAWYLGRNPDKEIITASYSADLALDFGSKTRDLINSEEYKLIFGEVSLKKDEQSKAKWRTNQGGSYISVGIGGALTGRGANILIIDDPIKNREEAESEVVRNSQWSWFTSCFVEGTPVLMADGTFKKIEEIKTGERVVSFKNGKLDNKTVLATGKQNKDNIYHIKCKYGEIKCTGEHPFYLLPVNRTGRYLGIKKGKWIKAKDIKKDDRLLFSLKGSKNGSSRRKRLYKSRKFVPKDLWWLAGFILGDGFLSKYKVGISLGKDEKLNNYIFTLCRKYFGKIRIVKKGREHTCYIDSKGAVDQLLHIGLGFENAKHKFIKNDIFKQPIKSREKFISGFLSADGHRISKNRWTVGVASKKLANDLRLLAINSGYLCGLVGKSEFIAQPPGSPKPINAVAYRIHLRKKRVGFYANRVLNINKVEKAHSYNLEVEDYGTFIANGFIVHNTAYTRLEPNGKVVIILTRWHLDDIAGRIIKNPEFSSKLKVIKFPAIATEDDQYRKKSDVLWKERYPLEEVESIKRGIGVYDFSSLYQQEPIASETQEFHQRWFLERDIEKVLGLETRNFLTIDTAISKNASADYTGIISNYVDRENKWNIKARRRRISPKELIDLLFTLQETDNYEKIGIEKTIYLDAIKPFLEDEMRKRDKFLNIVPLEHKQTQKEVRIRGLIPRYSSKSVFHIKGFCDELEEELLTFPKGLHDDLSDALAYQLQVAKFPAVANRKQEELWIKNKRNLSQTTR